MNNRIDKSHYVEEKYHLIIILSAIWTYEPHLHLKKTPPRWDPMYPDLTPSNKFLSPHSIELACMCEWVWLSLKA